MSRPGIDYGMGSTNVDHATGIRYGVISQYSVAQVWGDEAQSDYGKPTCPKCGNEAQEYDAARDFERGKEFDRGSGCSDYECEACEYIFDSSEAFGDEPQGWYVDDGTYKLTDCLDSDIFVIESPYYTFAPFCSPCVPGAGDLDSANPDGVKTYCLGHDWFEDSKAPYPVYSVATGQEVQPSE